MAKTHTVYEQRVYKNKAGQVTRTEGIGSRPCDCGQDNDHTKTAEVINQ